MGERRKIPAIVFHRKVRRREEVIFLSSPILLPMKNLADPQEYQTLSQWCSVVNWCVCVSCRMW